MLTCLFWRDPSSSMFSSTIFLAEHCWPANAFYPFATPSSRGGYSSVRGYGLKRVFNSFTATGNSSAVMAPLSRRSIKPANALIGERRSCEMIEKNLSFTSFSCSSLHFAFAFLPDAATAEGLFVFCAVRCGKPLSAESRKRNHPLPKCYRWIHLFFQARLTVPLPAW